MVWPWWSTKFATPDLTPADLHVWDYMKNVMYECKLTEEPRNYSSNY
jgi:hypothetical protein